MTHDNRDVDRLKQALKGATPEPDAAVRTFHINAAMENFTASQGMAVEVRHTSRGPATSGRLKRVIGMLAGRVGLASTTAVALVATTVVVFVPIETVLRDRDIPPPITDLMSREMAPQERSDAELPQGALSTDLEVPLAPVDQLPRAEVDALVPGRDRLVDPISGMSRLVEPSVEIDRLVNPDSGMSRLVDPVPTFSRIPAVTHLGDEFATAAAAGFQRVSESPVSTFSVDVDTASYTIIRRYIERGALPPVDAVRIEEMLNYFTYAYPTPEASSDAPLRPSVSLFETPWNQDTVLMHIGLQAPEPLLLDRQPLNLVFLVDTSGSMTAPDKLPLLIQSFRLMLDALQPGDEVSIVSYAGRAGVVLSPTDVLERDQIESALLGLRAGGSTNGIGGLRQAYDLADQMSSADETTRIVLATDGDFNIGMNDPEELAAYVSNQRDRGAYLSVLGFGSGNLQDDTMQALAQNGNGIAAYVDTLSEARRIMVDRIAGMLAPIANDVKLQIEFNPAQVAEYRLIGYETRLLEREDFRDDTVDAGDVGVGHSVTALYEIVPVGSPAITTDALRYAESANSEAPPVDSAYADEIGYFSIRWKAPGEEDSQALSFPVLNDVLTLSEITPDARFATALASFGLLLRGDRRLGLWGYPEAEALAATAVQPGSTQAERLEAIRLMGLAGGLAGNRQIRLELQP